MFKEIHRVNLAKSQCIFIFVPSLKIQYEIFQPKLIWHVYGQWSYWIWYRIENILWGLTTFNLQNGSEIVSLTLSLFSKYLSLGFSKPLSNWFICKLLSVLSTYAIQLYNWSLNSLFRKKAVTRKFLLLKQLLFVHFKCQKCQTMATNIGFFITWNASHLAIHKIKTSLKWTS